MKIILAETLGICFGVRDAIELALSEPEPQAVTILGELAHNPRLLQRLDEAGLRRVAAPDLPAPTRRVLIIAHGVADTVRARLAAQGHEIRDATCPLVYHAHRALRRLVAEGYFPVVIGRADHVEVRGLTGDLAEFAVIGHPPDLEPLRGRPRLGIVAQTTQPLDLVLECVAQIRAAYPEAEVRFIDTVCRPTKDRQEAARRLARAVEVVVVIGGRNSHNTRQLVQTCQREGATAYHVEEARELQPEWFAGVERVGITAGTSTPQEVIEEVRAALEQIGEQLAACPTAG